MPEVPTGALTQFSLQPSLPPPGAPTPGAAAVKGGPVSPKWPVWRAWGRVQEPVRLPSPSGRCPHPHHPIFRSQSSRSFAGRERKQLEPQRLCPRTRPQHAYAIHPSIHPSIHPFPGAPAQNKERKSPSKPHPHPTLCIDMSVPVPLHRGTLCSGSLCPVRLVPTRLNQRG